MAEITHRVGIKGSSAEIYQLLTTDQGLAKWWTGDTKGAGGVGSVIQFRFNGGGPDFRVTELIPDKRVVWQHSGEMPMEWMGTEVRFELSSDELQTFIRFTHGNWSESSDFMAHCSIKWAVFLLSLKQVIETGTGRPFPNDIQVDHSE